jgi:hypothetical protein
MWQGLTPPEYIAWHPASQCSQSGDEAGSWSWRLACLRGLLTAADALGRTALVGAGMGGALNNVKAALTAVALRLTRDVRCKACTPTPTPTPALLAGVYNLNHIARW